jgi:Ca-activated chloride channel family protein
MKINPRFTFDKIRHDQDNNIHLVLDLVAPKSDWQAKRPPLCIIPVIDRSGSMFGDKLHYAKQSLLKLVEHLSADDYFGLVSFESYVHVDAKPEKMTPERKEQMRALIHNYRTAGSTNLSSGLVEALKLVNDMDLHESTLTRVILFTDGQPTHGVTTAEGLKDLVSKQMGRASVSAFGYGVDACQELLRDMSNIGKGNFAFVKDPDSALSAFGKELGGLLSTYAQNIQVSVKPRNGHLISEILTDADVEEESDGEVTLKLPQILSEETFNIVVSAKMSKQKAAGPRQVNAFDVSVTYQILDSEGNLVTKTEDTKAKIQFVKDGEEQTKPTREVDEIVARAQLVRTQIAAEEAAKKGDYKTAGAMFTAFENSVSRRGLVAVANVSSHLHGMYGSATNYGSSSGSRTSLRGAMTRSVGSSGIAAEDELVLSSAGYVSATSAQVTLQDAFQSSGIGGASQSGIGGSGIQAVPGASTQYPAPQPFASQPVTEASPPEVEPKPSKKTRKSPSTSGLKKSRSQRW